MGSLDREVSRQAGFSQRGSASFEDAWVNCLNGFQCRQVYHLVGAQPAGGRSPKTISLVGWRLSWAGSSPRRRERQYCWGQGWEVVCPDVAPVSWVRGNFSSIRETVGRLTAPRRHRYYRNAGVAAQRAVYLSGFSPRRGAGSGTRWNHFWKETVAGRFLEPRTQRKQMRGGIITQRVSSIAGLSPQHGP